MLFQIVIASTENTLDYNEISNIILWCLSFYSIVYLIIYYAIQDNDFDVKEWFIGTAFKTKLSQYLVCGLNYLTVLYLFLFLIKITVDII